MLGFLAILFWSAFTIDANKPPVAPGRIAVVSPNPTPEATATSSPVPAPTAASSPVIAPTPSPAATPRLTSNRDALLDQCPDRPGCWLYTIRSGDNLFSIAQYFGVPPETVRRLNPWTRTSALRAGKQLILPPPTR